MPSVAQRAAGDFCWFELATSDQAAAKSFYASLFGWSAGDLPLGPGDFHSMFTLEGRHTGAVYTLRPDDRSAGVPPHWVAYVAVASAGRAAARALQGHGEILLPPTEMFDAGRMCFRRDPSGAHLAAWRSKRHAGSGIRGVAGTFCWADLMTPDPERAAAFYGDVFGWRVGPPNGLHGPMHVETAGRMAVMADPQGAVSALFQPLGEK